jgi:D-alanine-D-alanine ligase
MRIVVLVDWEACRYRAGGIFETLEGTEQHFVAAGLRANGREVVVLPFGKDIPISIARLRKTQPDVIFNLTASVATDRRNAHIVAGVLDLIGIPYTASSSAALLISLDKAFSKLVVRRVGVQTPNFITPEQGNHTRLDDTLQFPVIVKPRFGASSELLSRRSVVPNRERLADRVSQISKRSNVPLICEEFIDGRDISACVLGNDKLLVLPPREFRCDSLSKHAPRFETHQVKHDPKYQAKWKTSYCRARLTQPQKKEIVEISKRAYRALDLRDYARFDFRLTANNTFVFLEANAHPDLSPSPHSSFGLMSSCIGMSYSTLLNRIVRMALKRSRQERRF